MSEGFEVGVGVVLGVMVACGVLLVVLWVVVEFSDRWHFWRRRRQRRRRIARGGFRG